MEAVLQEVNGVRVAGGRDFDREGRHHSSLASLCGSESDSNGGNATLSLGSRDLAPDDGVWWLPGRGSRSLLCIAENLANA